MQGEDPGQQCTGINSCTWIMRPRIRQLWHLLSLTSWGGVASLSLHTRLIWHLQTFGSTTTSNATSEESDLQIWKIWRKQSVTRLPSYLRSSTGTALWSPGQSAGRDACRSRETFFEGTFWRSEGCPAFGLCSDSAFVFVLKAIKNVYKQVCHPLSSFSTKRIVG